MLYSKTKNAFSLVELSIVLIIIGLLVAGVSGGTKLISNTKNRTIILDFQKYKLAFLNFNLTYDEFPGDMSDSAANDFWGITNYARSASPAGDKFLDADKEGPMAFWHMSLAELIESGYTGADADAEVPGINVGKAKYAADTGFNFFTFGITANNWSYSANTVYEKSDILVLVFGKTQPEDAFTVSKAAITAASAYQIDKKLDDGLPNQGRIMSDHGMDVGSSNKCINYAKYASEYIAADAPLKYKLDNKEPACRMMYNFL